MKTYIKAIFGRVWRSGRVVGRIIFVSGLAVLKIREIGGDLSTRLIPKQWKNNRNH